MNKIILLIVTVLLAITAFFWYAVPILKPFPSLTGRHAVGSLTLSSTHPNRSESLSGNPTDKRTLMLHFFYPTDEKNIKKAPYLGESLPYAQKLFAQFYEVPEWLSKHLLNGITTNTTLDAPLSLEKQSYPVVLFSHGGLSFPSRMYTVLLQELASHGYIVVGIDHTSLNSFTLLPDGTLVSSQALSAKFNASSSQEQNEYKAMIIDTFKKDLAQVIDELKKLNEDPHSIFYGRLGPIGVMGHSAGGTAALEFCRTDDRCKAAIDLDGWYDHLIKQEPIKKPILLIFGQKSMQITEPTLEYLKRKELTREQYFARERAIENHIKGLCAMSPECTLTLIPHATHSDFDDAILLKWPFRSRDEAEPYATLALINKAIVDFFDTHLKRS